MSFELRAAVLFEGTPAFDIAAFAAFLNDRRPELGGVAAEPLTLTIAGEPYACALIESPEVYDLDGEDLKPMRLFDPAEALAACRSHLLIYAPSTGGGRAAAKRRAAALQTMVAAAFEAAPGGRAAFWGTSQGFQSPEAAAEAAERALDGVSPLEDWMQLYPLRPTNPELADRADLCGMLTLGLTPFIGREIELAAAPMPLEEAAQRCVAAAHMLLDAGAVFSDRDTISDADGGRFMLIRDAPEGWLRRGDGLGALVLIPTDSVVDPETLSVRDPNPDKRSTLSRSLERKH